ncbi:MAG: hypothetical protein ACM3ZF_08365 [Mycobacterium leprae]
MTRRARPRAVLSGAVTALVLLVGVAALPARASDGTGQPAPTQEARQLQAQLQAQLDSLVAKGVPGALAVVGDGRTTLRLASGAARVEPRQPMRPNRGSGSAASRRRSWPRWRCSSCRTAGCAWTTRSSGGCPAWCRTAKRSPCGCC